MLNAETLSVDDVEQMFVDQEFTEAAGVLDMISKTPEQKMQYNARLKFQMDEVAKLEYARDQGLREGEAKGEAKGLRKGELLGRVRVYQELLGVDFPSADELLSYDDARLSELADQLQRQLRSRPQ